LVVQGAAALPQVRAGTIKAIANLSPQRSLTMPDIPTSDEGGVPGLYMSGWFGFFAPKGTPKDSWQAQRRHGAGPRRSSRARALCRSRPRCCFGEQQTP
jgi:Tripartite tricarboxylate transporter family receptor